MPSKEMGIDIGVDDNKGTGVPQCQECQQLRTEFGVTEEESSTGHRRPLTTTGKVLLGLFGASFVGVTAVCLPFLLPAVRKVCLPFVPATNTQVRHVMKLLEGRQGTLVDLGSGDGRIVIEAARQGFHAVGIELNPWLVCYSRLAALRAGVWKQTGFYTKDLWKVDLSKFDNVVVFGVEQMMPKLEKKLVEEMTTDGVAVACRFPFPTWPVERLDGSGIDTVWLYTRKSLTENKDKLMQTASKS